MTTRPNLFAFGTSELTQDAALCWLLQWGDAGCAKVDPEMHRVGRALIEQLFAIAGLPAPDPGEVVVSRQVEKIDIVATFGATHALAIEDKVHTSQHSGQLARYTTTLMQKYAGRTVARIYLKTGDESPHASVRASGWTAFSRSDLLRVLRGPDAARNDVLREFQDHVERMEYAATAWTRLRPDEWPATRDPGPTGHALWGGFFTALRDRLGRGEWEYAANPRGGLMVFYWGFRDVPGGKIYLQLEEGRLMLKVEAKDRNRELRDRVLTQIGREELGDFRTSFHRPNRLGLGTWMTVAEYRHPAGGDYRVVGSDGLIDLPGTVERLNQVEAVLSLLT